MAKRSKKPIPLPSVAAAQVVSVAMSIAQINERDLAIQTELGVLNGRISKLYAEQAGIQTRRLELMRSFDQSARP